MKENCIDALNAVISRFTPEDTRLVATMMAKQIRHGRFAPLQRADLVLTECCNCRCSYCFEGDRPRASMTVDILERAIDFVFREAGDSRVVVFVLFGGEPLTRCDLVRHAVKYANRVAIGLGKRVGYEMTTNGTLLSEEIIDFGAANGLSYLLSLDGDRETHDRHRRRAEGSGTYDRIVRWIPYLKRRQRWLGARVTPMPDTVGRLAANIRHLRSLGLNQFLIGMAAGQKWQRAAIEVYREQWEEIADFYLSERRQGKPMRIKEFESSWDSLAHDRRNVWGCSGGRSQVTIAPDGGIYPCARFMSLTDPFTGGRGAYKLGTLGEGMCNLGCREELTNACGACRVGCLRCEFREACLGSCPAVNYEENDSIFRCSPYLCEEQKILLGLIRRRSELCTAGDDRCCAAGARLDCPALQVIGAPIATC